MKGVHQYKGRYDVASVLLWTWQDQRTLPSVCFTSIFRKEGVLIVKFECFIYVYFLVVRADEWIKTRRRLISFNL